MPNQNNPQRRKPRHPRSPRSKLPSRIEKSKRKAEKKWEPRLTAHAFAFGMIAERIPTHERARMISELSRLMRTSGAIDFLTHKKSIDASVFVREVVRLFSRKNKLAEEYLVSLRQYYPAR